MNEHASGRQAAPEQGPKPSLFLRAAIRATVEGDRLYRRFRGLPLQTRREQQLFRRLLFVQASRHARLRVFEWGSGASTIYYGQFLRGAGSSFEWHTMENAPDWHQWVTRRIAASGLSDAVFTHLSSFLAFWEDPAWDAARWRWAEGAPCTAAIRAYVSAPRRLGGGFDVMIVDGRYRKQCLLEAVQSLAEGGVVLLHDAVRRHYQPGLAVFPEGRFVYGGRAWWGGTPEVTWVGSIGDVAATDRVLAEGGFTVLAGHEIAGTGAV